MKALALPENLGIPAGRNRGVAQVSGEFLFFLDDDASLPDPGFLAAAIAKLRADPSIGLIQPRVVDPSGTTPPTRWIPRIRKGEADHSSNVFSVWEGAVILPRAVFDATGGWAEPFFYAHEGIELAWRVWDQGKRTWYAGDLVANHPVITPTRHSYYYRLNARNRVWLARRNLPAVFVPLYVASWTGVQLLRSAAQSRRPRRLVGRLARGLENGCRGASASPLAHGAAHDAGRAATGHLSRLTSARGCGIRGSQRRHSASDASREPSKRPG